MTPLETALGGAVTALVGAVTWLMLLLNAERKDCDVEKAKLHEAHKSEMRENGKALLSVTERTLGAIDHLAELEERRRS